MDFLDSLMQNHVPPNGGDDTVKFTAPIEPGFTVSAGDVVEFLRNGIIPCRQAIDANAYSNMAITTGYTNVAQVKMLKLDDRRVFIGFKVNTPSLGSVARIVTVNDDGSITWGVETILHASMTYIAFDMLTPTRILYVYSSGSLLYAKVLTISGDTITAGTEYAFDNTGSYNIADLSIATLDDTYAICIYCTTNSANDGMVKTFKVSAGNAITASTTKGLGITSYGQILNTHCWKIDSGKVIAVTYSSGYSAWSKVVPRIGDDLDPNGTMLQMGGTGTCWSLMMLPNSNMGIWFYRASLRYMLGAKLVTFGDAKDRIVGAEQLITYTAPAYVSNTAHTMEPVPLEDGYFQILLGMYTGAGYVYNFKVDIVAGTISRAFPAMDLAVSTIHDVDAVYMDKVKKLVGIVGLTKQICYNTCIAHPVGIVKDVNGSTATVIAKGKIAVANAMAGQVYYVGNNSKPSVDSTSGKVIGYATDDNEIMVDIRR